MIKKTLIILLAFFLLTNCTTTIHNHQVMDLMKKDDMAGALDLAKQKGYYGKKNSTLIRHLDLGILYYQNAQYYHALKEFETAQSLIEELQTIKISSVFYNQNYYNGETYDISMLHFYLSLTHFKLYSTGVYEQPDAQNSNLFYHKKLTNKERYFHLSASRSILLAWNSWTSKFASENKTIFTNDMLENTWGSFVQDQNMSNNTAQSLLKQIPILLQNNYIPHYPSSKATQQDLLEYQSNKLKTIPNLSVVFQYGLVSPKISKRITFQINKILAIAAAQGDLIFAYLAVPNGKLSFNILEVKKPNLAENIRIAIKQDDKTILTQKLSLIQPMSEIIYKHYGEDLEKRIQSKKTTLEATCLTAIATNYIGYKEAMELSTKTSNLAEQIAYKATALSFAAIAQKLCSGGDVDTRGWNTLPQAIYMASFRLDKGSYRAEYIRNKKIIKTQDFNIEENNQPTLLDVFVIKPQPERKNNE